MKGVILEVPVHSPVINHLAPVLDRLPSVFRYVINRNYKVDEFNGKLSFFQLRINGEGTKLEELDVTLLDRLLLQDFTWNLLESNINSCFSGNLSSGLI